MVRLKKEVKSRATDLKLSIQPFLIIVESIKDVQDVYVCIDNELHKVQWFLQSLDICFKTFHVLNFKYSLANEHLSFYNVLFVSCFLFSLLIFLPLYTVLLTIVFLIICFLSFLEFVNFYLATEAKTVRKEAKRKEAKARNKKQKAHCRWTFMDINTKRNLQCQFTLWCTYHIYLTYIRHSIIISCRQVGLNRVE